MLASIQARMPGAGGVKTKPPSRPEACPETALPKGEDRFHGSHENSETVEGHSGLEALIANFGGAELKPTEKVEEVQAATSSSPNRKAGIQDPARKAQQQRKLDGTGGSLKASKVRVDRPVPEQFAPAASRGAPRLEVPRPVGQAEASARSNNPTLLRQRGTLQIATRDRTQFSAEVSDNV